MKIAIMGFGTVGSGAYEIACDTGIEVVRILARHEREGYEYLNGILTPDIDEITDDPEIELVIESMGGIHPALEYVEACLKAGKHVVTPNKNLISEYHTELRQLAEDNGVELRFTSAVGGGIPWLFNLQRTRRCDRIISVRGIVNGTCNYILDAMHSRGSDFNEVLRQAQELGYAEADPSADIQGRDTLRKTVISAALAFGVYPDEDEVPCFGIDTITAEDVSYLRSRGLSCRLMMNAERMGPESISICVEPVAFGTDALEANVRKNNNLITLTAEKLGTQSFFGQGAGMLPTGESVIQDVTDIRDGVSMKVSAATSGLRTDNSSAVRSYYLRHSEKCGSIRELEQSFEEKAGSFFCITKPVTVLQMHEAAAELRRQGKSVFFAALDA